MVKAQRLAVAALSTGLVLTTCLTACTDDGDSGRKPVKIDATPPTNAPLPDPDPEVLTGAATPKPFQAAERPNVLVINLDDAAIKEQPYMPLSNELIGENGVTMETAFTPTPLCVPSRASFLTGQYAHNHGTVSIEGEGGGFPSFDDEDTLPIWLQAAGYDTMFVGKYLNGYTADELPYEPPGWTVWRPTVDFTTYNFLHPTLLVDGEQVETDTYSTTLLADTADDLIADPDREEKPWFMWLNYVAPHHGGPKDDDDPPEERDAAPVKTTRPAAEDKDTFKDLPNFSTPDMFEEDPHDKVLLRGAYNKWSETGKKDLTEARQQRIESLQAVDRSVAATIKLLDETGQLDNTYVILTSDNGYVLGEHNMVGKLNYLKDVVQVPMQMRGPGLPAGFTSKAPITVADLAPTISALAGATPGPDVDGVNMLPWLLSDADRRVVPIEAFRLQDGGDHPAMWTGVSVGPWLYVRGTRGKEELYDRTSDPYELINVRKDERFKGPLKQLRALNKQARDCAADTCPTEFYTG